jgi:IclR family KDG regulon transcriptional repressor
MLQTIGRAGRVLALFDPDHPEWGATALARELDVAKSQAHELLFSLAEIGLLRRAGAGRYRLGWRIVALNSTFLDTSDLGPEATRAIRGLVGRCGETLQLAVWAEGRPLCVAAYAGRGDVAVSPWPVGADLPSHCTGAGKMLLANRPPEEVRDVLARHTLERMTVRTIVTSEQLGEELESVRVRGLAYEREEQAPSICGVAAPIHDTSGRVVAALSMSVPVQRWRRGEREYTRALVATATRASKAIGRAAERPFQIAERRVDAAGVV